MRIIFYLFNCFGFCEYGKIFYRSFFIEDFALDLIFYNGMSRLVKIVLTIGVVIMQQLVDEQFRYCQFAESRDKTASERCRR